MRKSLLWISCATLTGCIAEPVHEAVPRPGTEKAADDDLRAVASARRAFTRDFTARLEEGAHVSVGTELFAAERSVLAPASSELNTPFDVLLYNLDIDIDQSEKTFEGDLDVLALVTRRTDEVVLDVGTERIMYEFIDGEIVEVGRYNPYLVTSVRRGSRELEFTQDRVEGTLTIELDRAMRPLEVMTLAIEYTGLFNTDEFASDGLLEVTSPDGEPVVHTFSWPDHARMWLPSVDHPRDPAAWLANVRIDNGVTLLSNGTRIRNRVRTEPDGTTTSESTFVMLQPVPTYALQIVSGNYTEVPLGSVDGVPVSTFLYPIDAASAEGVFGDVPEALAFFNETFGPYPFDRFSLVESSSSLSGMEHATMVSVSDVNIYFYPEEARAVGIHELSHHWFGDNLHQSEWAAFWLNESLATYATALALGHIDGPEAYDAELAELREEVFQRGNRFAGTLHFPPPDLPPINADLFEPYSKGAWIWHMLRVELGDERFFGFLRHFTRTHYFRKYDTPIVRDALERYTHRDFTTFFGEWVYAPGYPQIVVVPSYDPATGVATVHARQTQAPANGTFTLTGNLAIELELDDADPATAPCPATLEFATGAITSDVSVPCAFAPTEIRHVNAGDLLGSVTPPPDPLVECADFAFGDERDCGWVDRGSFDCTPGTTFEVGCASECMVGSCDGDAMVRICEGEEPCPGYDAIASDVFGCGFCGIATVTCPASGRYTVLSASFVSFLPHECTPGTR